MTESEFGIATVYRIIKKAGAERISDDAAEELRNSLEEIARLISSQAVEFSRHAGRKTVRSSDIRLAAKNIVKT